MRLTLLLLFCPFNSCTRLYALLHAPAQIRCAPPHVSLARSREPCPSKQQLGVQNLKRAATAQGVEGSGNPRAGVDCGRGVGT